MRALFVLAIAALLSACASKEDPSRIRQIAQDGALRVHPGLLGQPVPPDPVNAAPRKPKAEGTGVAPAWSQQSQQQPGSSSSSAPAAPPATSGPQWLNS